MSNGSDWYDIAACRRILDDQGNEMTAYQRTQLFFGDGKDKVSEARAKHICSGCFVQRQCLRHSLEHDEQGIWGGLTDSERHEKRRELEVRYVPSKT